MTSTTSGRDRTVRHGRCDRTSGVVGCSIAHVDAIKPQQWPARRKALGWRAMALTKASCRPLSASWRRPCKAPIVKSPQTNHRRLRGELSASRRSRYAICWVRMAFTPNPGARDGIALAMALARHSTACNMPRSSLPSILTFEDC